MAFLAALSGERKALKKVAAPEKAAPKKYPVVGMESLMAAKAHGTTETAVQEGLRWGADREVADRICSFNRHAAERKGSWLGTTFLEAGPREERFYDSVTGKLLFTAPQGRTWEAFVEESRDHGWPSFRDAEVCWDSVRCLLDGECVSVDGTHLGHNLPDAEGNRYCINLVSCAGAPRPE